MPIPYNEFLVKNSVWRNDSAYFSVLQLLLLTCQKSGQVDMVC